MRRRDFLFRLGGVGALLAFPGCAHLRREEPAVLPSAVPGLVAERLRLAHDVAWAKFQAGAPILDPEREAALLASLVARANDRGLDPVWVETFFAAQIAASRQVQAEWHAAWREDAAARPATAPLDLRAQIRPRLDRVTAALLDTMPAGPNRELEEVTRIVLAREGYSAEVVELATAPLRGGRRSRRQVL
jgi:chorismate mutase-like protein